DDAHNYWAMVPSPAPVYTPPSSRSDGTPSAAGGYVSPADRTQERELGQFQGHPGGLRNRTHYDGQYGRPRHATVMARLSVLTMPAVSPTPGPAEDVKRIGAISPQAVELPIEEKKKMSSIRKTAIAVALLFLTSTVAFGIGSIL